MEIIRAHREAAGLTQRQLADLVGVTDQTISNLERGTTRPALDTARALARVLQIPVEALFASEAPTEDVGKSS
jgi:putative transcriptional regulator